MPLPTAPRWSRWVWRRCRCSTPVGTAPSRPGRWPHRWPATRRKARSAVAVHALAAALCCGALAALALTVEHRGQWARVLPRFFQLSLLCVATLLAAGIAGAAVTLDSRDRDVDPAGIAQPGQVAGGRPGTPRHRRPIACTLTDRTGNHGRRAGRHGLTKSSAWHDGTHCRRHTAVMRRTRTAKEQPDGRPAGSTRRTARRHRRRS
jgi:hypothetical protein